MDLSQVIAAETVPMREKAKIRAAERAADVIYRYLTPLCPSEVLLVTLQTGDAVTLLRLPAEKGLENALLSFRSQ